MLTDVQVEKLSLALTVLNDAGIVTTVRKTRGEDIDAACGQLAAGQPVVIGTKAK